MAGEFYKGTDFDNLSVNELKTVQEDTEKRYLLYVFLKHNSTQHGTLKKDLVNNYYKDNNHYPKTRQETLYLFNKYNKPTVTRTVISEKSSFVQTSEQNRGGNNNSSGGNNQDYDNKYWKNKTCYNCNKKEYPVYACSKTFKKKKRKEK